MKRAHQEEEDGPAQEKRRRLDSLNSSGSKNRSGFSRIEVDLETSGSDAKSKNGRLAVLLECDTCHKVETQFSNIFATKNKYVFYVCRFSIIDPVTIVTFYDTEWVIGVSLTMIT